MPEHEHKPLPVARPADPKICECGQERDPVTHGWYTHEALMKLREERASRRSAFGDSQTANQMNREGL